MALGEGGPAPYAPANAVVAVIDKYRQVGFAGQPITAATLQKIEVQESLIPRTLASLRQLGLTDDDGKPTDQFDALKNARPDEFHDRLGEWLRDTYAPIFGHCDPANSTIEQITAAFWGYDPAGQRPRMANLFVGLAEYAGIIGEAPTRPRGRHAAKAAAKGRTSSTRDSTTSKNGGKGDRKDDPPGGGRGAGGHGGGELSDYRQRYLEMLISRAETANDADPELLDRIERALGIAPARVDSS